MWYGKGKVEEFGRDGEGKASGGRGSEQQIRVLGGSVGKHEKPQLLFVSSFPRKPPQHIQYIPHTYGIVLSSTAPQQ